MKGRSASVRVEYQGVNITDEVTKDLLSFEYVDNASGASDTVALTLKDEKHIWLKDWFPEKGDVIYPTIQTNNWLKDGEIQLLPCGRFFIDEPEYSGRPSTFTLNGISSPLNGNFKDANKTRAWRNINLKSIAGDIAERAGLELQYLSNNNPLYTSKEQSETPDSTFLSELCEEEGLSMKVTDSKIVIFDEKDFEQRPVVATYNESNDNVLSYSFKSSLAGTNYAGVRVRYYDSKLGRNIEYLHVISELKDDSKIYEVNQKVSSGDEARRLAQKTARRLNKKGTTGSITVVGNLELLGGVTVNLTGFGAFSGKYFVESATHSIDGGYTTRLEIRKVLEGY